MKPAIRVIALLVAVCAVACIASWVTAHYVDRHARHEAVETHAWIHTQLDITAEQDKALEPIEQRFDEKKKHYAELIRIANKELAQAILEDRADSPRVTAAVGRIHQAMGELQNATLQHIFEMKPVLTPQQYDKLLQLTAEALTGAEHGR
jgi:Spy/CpxP family protein refolding chaperone